MSVGERIKRYKTTGGAAGFSRVEVLVPPDGRDEVLALAARLRRKHRIGKAMRDLNAEAVNDRAKLMMHRILARRIARDPGLVDKARRLVEQRAASGGADAGEREWMRILDLGPAAVRSMITSRDDRMKRLRASSPLAEVAGMTDPDTRRRIWRAARVGLARRVAHAR